MSFSQTLERLKEAVSNPPPGTKHDRAIVRRKDLDELIYHFERFDHEARQRHYEEHKGGR